MNAAQQLWLEQVGTVLETLNQGLIINDESKRVVFTNSMFLEMIKMRSSDLLVHSIVNLYPTEDVPRLLEFITRREMSRTWKQALIAPPGIGVSSRNDLRTTTVL